MEKKCRSCGAGTEFRGHTPFSRGERIIPAEARLCPRCESVRIFIIGNPVNHEAAHAHEQALFDQRLEVQRHDGLIEVMCPRCRASMFFVQHSDVIFGNVDVLAESWICECGTTLEIAKSFETARLPQEAQRPESAPEQPLGRPGGSGSPGGGASGRQPSGSRVID